MSNVMRPVWYVCAPVKPTADEISSAASTYWSAICRDLDPSERQPYAARLATGVNVVRAGRWLKWLRQTWPDVTFIAPWLGPLALRLEDDADPAQREAGLIDCEAVVPRCTGVVLVGGRIGSGGMRERAVARHVVDLLYLGTEPPMHGYVDANWKAKEWRCSSCRPDLFTTDNPMRGDA